MAKNSIPVNPLGKSFYIPSLDGLRFFAFLLVFFHHSLFNTSSTNPALNYIFVLFQKNGWVGVDLFFILSGFLITTLLLRERAKYGRYSLKDFWIRRGLRIWPLYYLALFSGFFLIPFLTTVFWGTSYSDPQYAEQIRTQLPFYVAFLGNWAVVLYSYSAFINISHLWTISIEEQFYFLWPLLLLFIRNIKSALLIIGAIVILATLVRLHLNLEHVFHPGIYVNTFARVDTLAIGALVAIILFYKPQSLDKIKNLLNTPLLIVSLLVFSIFLYKISLFDPYIIRNGTFGYLVVSAFMSYYLLSALNIRSAFSHFLSKKFLVWGGKISYGLYVWHIFGIELTSHYTKKQLLSILNPDIAQIILSIIALLVTLILGFISYNFYERHFLKLKTKFTKIISRPV